MPSFREPDGMVWVWDPDSKTYVKKPGHSDVNRGEAFGGDASLFSPNQIEHSEKTKNPLQEGILAAKLEFAPPGKVLCPNCREPSDSQSCHLCGKDLTPEWLKLQDKDPGEDFQDQQADADVASEFLSWPDRVPKRNREKTDDSYPSMVSKVAGSWVCPKCGFCLGEDDMRIGQCPSCGVDFQGQPQRTEYGQPGDSYLPPSYNKKQGGNCLSDESTMSRRPEFFSHIIEEDQWRLANEPSLDECPECYSPMVDKNGEKVCHSCGHKQPIVHSAGMFGDDEQGGATKNRGENSDPESGSGASFKEKGDGPELLKDVGGGPVNHDDQSGGDPELQKKALQAFELNKPLVMEFYNSEEAGADHPILKALDELLETAFPGYKELEDEVEALPQSEGDEVEIGDTEKEPKEEKSKEDSE